MITRRRRLFVKVPVACVVVMRWNVRNCFSFSPQWMPHQYEKLCAAANDAMWHVRHVLQWEADAVDNAVESVMREAVVCARAMNIALLNLISSVRENDATKRMHAKKELTNCYQTMCIFFHALMHVEPMNMPLRDGRLKYWKSVIECVLEVVETTLL